MDAIDLLASVQSLDRVPVKLSSGGKVAAVGGLPPGTLLIATAYPRSRFLSFAAHPEDVARGRQLAVAWGVDDRVTFEIGWRSHARRSSTTSARAPRNEE